MGGGDRVQGVGSCGIAPMFVCACCEELSLSVPEFLTIQHPLFPLSLPCDYDSQLWFVGVYPHQQMFIPREPLQLLLEG